MCLAATVLDSRQKRKSEIRNLNTGLCEHYEKKDLILIYVNIISHDMILTLSILSLSLQSQGIKLCLTITLRLPYRRNIYIIEVRILLQASQQIRVKEHLWRLTAYLA
jgi:hypothetical protein